MPAIKALSMTDGTNTTSLIPSSRTNGIQEYRSTSGTIRAAKQSVKFSLKDQSNAQRVYLKLTVPIVVTDTSTNEEIVRENTIFEITGRVPHLLDEADRSDIVEQLADLLQNETTGLGVEVKTGEGQY